MEDIHVKTTQEDIIIAHQAKKIVFLELQLAKAMKENDALKAQPQSAPAGKKEA